ncbi:MAG: thioredoxin family protein [Verrucomicrobiales bacterium]|nr:thioredoxin family protein [Verrucomicrobiales bacterium]
MMRKVTTLVKWMLILMAAAGFTASAQIPDFGAPKKASPLAAEWVLSVNAAAPGQPFSAGIRLKHAPHYHSYGKTLSPGIIGKPTRLIFSLPEGWTAQEGTWPPVKAVTSTDGKPSEGYEGTVILPVTLTPPANAPTSGSVTLNVTVDALVCDPSSCMPVKVDATTSLALAATAQPDAKGAAALGGDPKTDPVKPAETAPPAATTPPPAPAEKPLVETPPPAPETAASTPAPETASTPEASPDANAEAAPESEGETEAPSFGMLLLFALIGGLILNVMPCVFPVLGIKIMSVVKQAGEDKRQVLLHGLAYTAGTLVCFWILTGVLASLRGVGQELGWGFQLQSAPFVFTLLLIVFVFGLNMVGVFEVGSSAVGAGQNLQNRNGLTGSFFSGLLAVVVATPCAAPFLAPSLGVALQLPLLPSLVFFSFMGLGLALPYLLLGLFPGLLKLLPRPGAWMESFKQGMAFLLFATAAYLIWTLDGMVDEFALRGLLLGLVLIALGCWIYGRWCLPHRTTKARTLGLITALAAFLSGAAWGWPDSRPPGLDWVPWTPDLVKIHHEDYKQPVYVDFTARWCFTCQTNKLVYHDREIQELFHKYDVMLLKADWTNNDPAITRALFELGKAAVPVNVLYIPGVEKPYVLDGLDGLLTEDLVKEALAKLEKPAAP